MSRGYFGIGIYHPKKAPNIGTLWRSAFNFGASFIFVIGKRFRSTSSDTVKAWKHIPFYEYQSFEEFYEAMPKECRLVGIECPGTVEMTSYLHPERAIYLLGSEDYGLPEQVKEKCHDLVQIKSNRCLNVGVAGSIAMFHRSMQ